MDNRPTKIELSLLSYEINVEDTNVYRNNKIVTNTDFEHLFNQTCIHLYHEKYQMYNLNMTKKNEQKTYFYNIVWQYMYLDC